MSRRYPAARRAARRWFGCWRVSGYTLARRANQSPGLAGDRMAGKRVGTMRSALVLISHDRRFLTQLSTGTLWLDRGKTRRFDWGFSKFEACRDELLEQEEIERHKLDRKIAAELDWVRHGVAGVAREIRAAWPVWNNCGNKGGSNVKQPATSG